MDSNTKTLAISELKDNFMKAKAVFFADYKGLTVEQVNDLRKRLRSQNVKVKVVKNNLARRAVAEAGLGDEPIKLLDTVVGPTMVAFTFGDPAAVAKTVKKFSEENEAFGLKDSLLGNQRLTTSNITELSTLPSKEVLLAKMLGSLNAPITNFVGVLAAVPRSLVQVLAAVENKKKSQA